MLVIAFIVALGSGWLVSTPPTWAALRQRVYVPAQTIRVTSGPATLTAWCLDPERARLASSDVVNVWSTPENLVITKIKGGQRIAQQRWAEVSAKDGGEAWVEILGTSKDARGFDLQVRPRQLEPGITYELEVTTGMVAAREADPPTLDLLARVEKFKPLFEEVDRFWTELAVFAEDSIIKTLVAAYSQEEIYWASDKPSLEALQAHMRTFRARLVTFLQDASPEDTYWRVLAFGGPLQAFPARQHFWRRHGVGLPPALPQVSPAGAQAAAGFLRSLRLEDLVDALSPSQWPGQDAWVKDVRAHVQAGLGLLREWERAHMPVGDGSQITRAVALRASDPFRAALNQTGMVMLTAPKTHDTLAPSALGDLIQDFVPLLRKADSRAALIEDLSQLLDSPTGRTLPRPTQNLMWEVRAHLRALARAEREDFPSPPTPPVRVMNRDRDHARRVERAAWKLVRLAKTLALSPAPVPARLQELLQAHSRVPAGWLERLPTRGIVLVDVHAVPLANLAALALELANLEDLTGLTLHLLLHPSPDLPSTLLSSHARATALWNGQTLTIAVHESLTASARPEISIPVYDYLQWLIEKLQGQRPDILFVGRHIKDGKCVDALHQTVTDGTFAGKHVILGLCPLRENPARSYEVVRQALDPTIGKAVSVVSTNHAIDIPALGLAIDSILKMPEHVRKRLAPVELLRAGYEKSWERLSKCLEHTEAGQREAALRQEFGILANVILQILYEKGEAGARWLEQVLREQPRYFNGMTLRVPRDEVMVIVPA